MESGNYVGTPPDKKSEPWSLSVREFFGETLVLLKSSDKHRYSKGLKVPKSSNSVLSLKEVKLTSLKQVS